MEIQSFPRGAACGLRKLTTNHLIAARLAEQTHGLPTGVKHPNRLLAAMRRASPYLGYSRLLPLMEALFRWTQPQDWAPGDDPVVWPSNEELALVLDCSERHVSRLIAAAIEARLIVARDGSDRKRRGYRENGRIIWAWGLSLRPMAARYPDFLKAIEEGDAERTTCRLLRRKAAAARQAITQLIELARLQNYPTSILDALHDQACQMSGGLKRITEAHRLKHVTDALEAIREQATEWLEHAVENANMSGSGDSHVVPILLTIEDLEPKGSTVAAIREEADSPPLPQTPTPEPLPMPLNLAPTELVRLAPRLERYLITDRPGWNDIADAAAVLSSHLGIPKALYGEACRTIGRYPTAIAIAIISTKRPDYFHTAGPGGYLRGMLRRAERNQLHLDRSIFGLRDATGYRRHSAVGSQDGPLLRYGSALKKPRFRGTLGPIDNHQHGLGAP